MPYPNEPFIFEQLPEALYTAEVADLWQLLKAPTVYIVNGGRQPPLFVSCLLHGNEHTSFLACQKLLRKYHNQQLPRSLILLLGNVEAAAQNQRKLDSQKDFNRIWRDEDNALAAAVKQLWIKHRPIAIIDIHNNTGCNPLYACVTKMEAQHLQLGNLFSRNLVYFTHPDTTLSVVGSDYAPAVTLECGLSGVAAGVQTTFEFLDSCLHIDHLPEHLPARHDYNLYETCAIIKVDTQAKILFFSVDNDKHYDIVLRPDIDCLNFNDVAAGTALGFINNPQMAPWVISAKDEGTPLHGLLKIDNGILIAAENLIPSMFTCNVKIIKEDCLGYLMREPGFASNEKTVNAK